MPQRQEDIKYMERCLELAKLGKQSVSPNPMVGAVLVFENRIIGEGYHQKCGEAHAEVNAINNVQESDQELIPKSTIYVSLEPCSHHGKTPPCSDLIIRSKIQRVVIGCMDTFSEVAGKGIEKLRAHGIDVIVGVLEDEARELNKRFFTYHEQKRPYVILKWAQTQDGFIDKLRAQDSTGVNWITAPETQQLTHQWRAEEDAILVGYRTIMNDNPSLTVRAVEGKHPLRIVLCNEDAIPSESKVKNDDVETIFYNSRELSLEEIMEDLHKRAILSVIIEGGQQTLQRFIDKDLWDEARVLIGNTTFETGLPSPVIQGKLMSEFMYGKDQIKVYRND